MVKKWCEIGGWVKGLELVVGMGNGRTLDLLGGSYHLSFILWTIRQR